MCVLGGGGGGGGICMLSRKANLPFSFVPPLSMGVNSKREEFAPQGANSFL